MGYKNIKNILYCCVYDVIWCPKYRRKILTDKIAMRTKEMIEEYAFSIKADIIQLEIEPDYIHLIIGVDPTIGIHKAIAGIKKHTAAVLGKEFPELKTKLPAIWTSSYLVTTVSPNDKFDINDQHKKYIDNQPRSQRERKG